MQVEIEVYFQVNILALRDSWVLINMLSGILTFVLLVLNHKSHLYTIDWILMGLFGGSLHFFLIIVTKFPLLLTPSLGKWSGLWFWKDQKDRISPSCSLPYPRPLLPHAASNLSPFMPLLVSVKRCLCFHSRQIPCTHVLGSITASSVIFFHICHLLFSPISTISTCKCRRFSPKTGTESLSLLVDPLFQLCLSTF